VPPRVDYELTERAKELLPVVGELARWGYNWAWSPPRPGEAIDIGAIFRCVPGLHMPPGVRGTIELTVRRANGDLDLFVFADGHDLAHSLEAGEGTWRTVGHGFDAYRHITLSDVDLDGTPDLLAVDAEGALLAFRNTGKLLPGAAEDLFQEPVTIGEGFQRYDVVC